MKKDIFNMSPDTIVRDHTKYYWVNWFNNYDDANKFIAKSEFKGTPRIVPVRTNNPINAIGYNVYSTENPKKRRVKK